MSSTYFTKLSFPAAMLCLIVGLSLPKLTTTRKKVAYALLAGSALCSAVATVRFVLLEAIPGVIAGGRTAVEKQAVSFLRSIVLAQDHARKLALIDNDHNGVGAALNLPELVGEVSQALGPGGIALVADDQARLIQRSAHLFLSRSGYLFQVCLPEAGGSFSAAEGLTRDETRSEREYYLYAWPERTGQSAPTAVYFADQDERILTAPLEEHSRWAGTEATPDCDVALREAWPPWKDKEARPTLPGAPD